jgi:hypothetical protein
VSAARGPKGASPTDVPTQPSQVPEDLRCLVTVSRKHEADARTRQVIVTLDDQPSKTLLFGEAFTLEVSAGQHLLRAHNTLFWKKLQFALEPGEHLELIVINRPGRLTLGFLAILGVSPLYLSIEKRVVR